MKELFAELKRCLAAGEDTVLVSILAESGSAPRGVGAHMLVGGGGRICGTIGGGAVEHRSEQLALEAIKERRSLVREYHLSRDLGMICGGTAMVLYQFLPGHDADMLALAESALALFAAEADAWLVTRLAEGADWCMGIAGREQVPASLGLGMEELRPWLGSGPASFEQGGAAYYVEPVNAAGRVLIFGGGHVAQALAPVLARLDFNCWVMDNRAELIDERLFPGVKKVILGEYENIGAYIEIRPDDYAVVMTHGHAADYVVQRQVMRANPAYIGVIGSKNKVRTLSERLLAEGFSAEQVAAVHAPIGLAIKAETPAEIAISIAAELIKTRAERKGNA